MVTTVEWLQIIIVFFVDAGVKKFCQDHVEDESINSRKWIFLN
jgi:hypothetical protein